MSAGPGELEGGGQQEEEEKPQPRQRRPEPPRDLRPRQRSDDPGRTMDNAARDARQADNRTEATPQTEPGDAADDAPERVETTDRLRARIAATRQAVRQTRQRGRQRIDQATNAFDRELVTAARRESRDIRRRGRRRFQQARDIRDRATDFDAPVPPGLRAGISIAQEIQRRAGTIQQTIDDLDARIQNIREFQQKARTEGVETGTPIDDVVGIDRDFARELGRDINEKFEEPFGTTPRDVRRELAADITGAVTSREAAAAATAVAVAEPTPLGEAALLGVGIGAAAATAAATQRGQEFNPEASPFVVDQGEVEVPEEGTVVGGAEFELPEDAEPVADELEAPSQREPVQPVDIEVPEGREPVSGPELEAPEGEAPVFDEAEIGLPSEAEDRFTIGAEPFMTGQQREVEREEDIDEEIGVPEDDPFIVSDERLFDPAREFGELEDVARPTDITKEEPGPSTRDIDEGIVSVGDPQVAGEEDITFAENMERAVQQALERKERAEAVDVAPSETEAGQEEDLDTEIESELQKQLQEKLQGAEADLEELFGPETALDEDITGGFGDRDRTDTDVDVGERGRLDVPERLDDRLRFDEDLAQVPAEETDTGDDFLEPPEDIGLPPETEAPPRFGEPEKFAEPTLTETITQEEAVATGATGPTRGPRQRRRLDIELGDEPERRRPDIDVDLFAREFRNLVNLEALDAAAEVAADADAMLDDVEDDL